MNSLKPSMLSECDLHCLDKICIWPLRLPLHTIRANIFRTRKIFPVSNADALTGFLALCPPPHDTLYPFYDMLQRQVASVATIAFFNPNQPILEKVKVTICCNLCLHSILQQYSGNSQKEDLEFKDGRS